MVSLSPEFVHRLLKRGYSEGSIREVLDESGFTRREIKQAFAKQEKPKPVKETVKKIKKHRVHKSHPQTIIKVSFVAQLLLIGLFAAAVIPLIEPGTMAGMVAVDTIDCGYDMDCFKSIAKDCDRATVLKDLDGTTLRFTSKQCQITKTIEEFGLAEPQQIVDLFAGKKMKCKFKQGKLPDELLEGLALGIEDCRGPLKDALIELSQAS